MYIKSFHGRFDKNVVIITGQTMTQAPAVSVIMPAYNAERTIASSIDSVKQQTYTDWELIVIDDASADMTVQVVRKAAQEDSRIRLYLNENNVGIAGSRNFGIQQARGNWIAFLDSDDRWHEDKLQKQLDFIEAMSAKVSYTGTAYVNEAGVRSGYTLRVKEMLKLQDLLKGNLMSCSSVIVCRDLMLRFPFPKGKLHEDYVVWMQVVKETTYAYGLDEPLLLYRLSGSSHSGRRLRSAVMIYRSYRVAGYGVVTAVVFTLRYALHSVSKRLRVWKGWR